MAAYFLYDLREVVDADKLDTYRAGVLATVRQYDGRYRMLGGDCRALEGDWLPRFPVLIEFPGSDRALAWYHSDQYRDLKALRLAGARGDAVLVDASLDPAFAESG